MAKSCKYCVNLLPDCFCMDKRKYISEEHINLMSCKEFTYTPVDAITGKEYTPRKERKNDGEQIVIQLHKGGTT